MTEPRRWTARELLETRHPEPIFVVDDLLPVGLTILAGRPKSGKSRTALDLAVRVNTGGEFLGYKCNSGAVTYYALEDGPRRLARRLQALKAPQTEELSLWCEAPEDLVGDIERKFCEENVVLVVVDTVGRAFHLDHNDMEQAYAVYAPLQHIATKYERALLVIAHLRKSRGEMTSVEDVSGSIGKAASADNLWLLDRPPRKRNATLDIVSRDLGEDLSLALEPAEGGGWRCTGDAEAVKRTEGRQKILDATVKVSLSGDEITVSTVTAFTGIDKGYVSRTLNELVEYGDLVRLPKRGQVQPFALAYPVNFVNKVNNGTER